MKDFVLSAFSGHRCEYRFDRDNVRFTLLLDSGLFQSEDGNQHINDKMHTHPYYEWFFVTNGSMRITTPQQSLVLKKHDFVVIHPGQEHCVSFLQKGTTRYNLNFNFEKNGLSGGQDLFAEMQALLGENPVVSGAGTQEMADINRRLSQLCGTNRRAMLCACFDELLIAMQEIISGVPAQAPVADFLTDPKLSRESKIRRVFDAYYMYDISMGYVAECMGISTRQLGRIIRQAYGCTWHERLSYMRICSAGQLLEKTDFTISEIARWVGYTSLYGFYNAFKAHFGCLPTEYRKKMARG